MKNRCLILHKTFINSRIFPAKCPIFLEIKGVSKTKIIFLTAQSINNCPAKKGREGDYIHNSTYSPCVISEVLLLHLKREMLSVPLSSQWFEIMASHCVSIACRMWSIFSPQLEWTSLINQPFVRRDGFLFWNFSFKSPYFKFVQVFLIDWSNIMELGLLTGELPISFYSRPLF